MNPVDQLLQSFGGTASNAVFGLLGAAPSGDTAKSSPDMLFSGALEQVSATAPANAPVQGILDAHFVAGVEGSAFGFAPPPEVNGAVNLRAFLGLPNNAPISDVFSQLGQVSALPVQAESVTIQGGQVPALGPFPGDATSNTAPVPIAPSEKLAQLGLRLEQLPALPSGEQIAAVSDSNKTPAARILQPDALLTALSTTPQAVDRSTETPLVPAAAAAGIVDTSGAEMTVSQAPTPILAPATPEAAAAQLTDPGQPVAQDGMLTSLLSPQEPANASGPVATERLPETQANIPETQAKMPVESVVEAPELRPHATTHAAANVTAHATAPETVTTADPTQQPDGHVTATIQQASNVQASNAQATTKKTTPAATGKHATGNDTFSPSKIDHGTMMDTAKETGSAKPVEQVVQRAEAMAPPPQLPKEATRAPTPERLSGFLDTTAASSVASGLTSMRGEGTFLSSMGLLGGRVSPEFAQQVGQQFNMQVSKAVQNGQKEFTVRLDPAELGRVQVKMSFGKDGSVQTRVLVERAETLELLQKDTKALERAIASGGNKIDGGIQFGLDSNNEQSAGRAFAEAVQQEKMRDDLAARSGLNAGGEGFTGHDAEEEIIPLDQILASVSAETGVDISV